MSQAALDACGERDAIFKAFRAWQNARAVQAFSKRQKLKLRDPGFKFHLEQSGERTFVLYSVKEIRLAEHAGNDAKQVAITNPYDTQPLQFSLRVSGPADGCAITLPDGSRITSDKKMDNGQFIICKGGQAYLADHFRKKIAVLPSPRPADPPREYPGVPRRGAGGVGMLPKGESKIGVQFPGITKSAKLPFELTVWASARGEAVGK